MTDHKFNMYLRKYQNEYTNIKRDSDGTWKIHGKFGEIAPYAPEKGLLGVWYMGDGISKRKSSTLRKALKDILEEIHQDGDIEFGGFFVEENLEKVAKIIKAFRKPQYSRDVYNAKRQAMLKVRHNGKKKSDQNEVLSHN